MIHYSHPEIQAIMHERFGNERLMTIATSEHNIPYIRAVNAVYENGWFYFATLSNSSKMKQMEENPVTAICGPWFNGHGLACNLGSITKEENRIIYQKLRRSFESWLSEARINREDSQVVLCGIQMTKAVLYSNNQRFDLFFDERKNQD